MSIVDPIRDERGWASPARRARRRRGQRLGVPVRGLRRDGPGLRRAASPCRCCGTRETGRIVNNESADIIVMLNSAFDEFAARPGARPLPRRRCATRSTRSTRTVYENVNNGVYRAGFASHAGGLRGGRVPAVRRRSTSSTSGSPTRRYLVGEQPDAGRLAPVHDARALRLRCTSATSSATCGGSSTTRTCRATCATSTRRPGVAETVDIDQIKRHYYATHARHQPEPDRPGRPAARPRRAARARAARGLSRLTAAA